MHVLRPETAVLAERFHALYKLMTMSSADFLDDYFDSDIIKGWLSSSSIIGSKVGPRSQGSGLVLLFHNLGEHDGHFGSWAFHKGGNGGFTQVLLEQGAAHVTAIDVGHGQFDTSLLSNPHITSIEGLNARDLTADNLKHKIDFIVCDVSFISLKLALPKALALVESGAQLLALIKPQFEAGREAVGRGGLVSDPSEHARVCKEITDFLTAENWKVTGLTPASIEGGDGNKEFLIAAVKN